MSLISASPLESALVSLSSLNNRRDASMDDSVPAHSEPNSVQYDVYATISEHDRVRIQRSEEERRESHLVRAVAHFGRTFVALLVRASTGVPKSTYSYCTEQCLEHYAGRATCTEPAHCDWRTMVI